MLKAAVRQAMVSWHDWQGSLGSIFLFSLQPAAFGERLYALTPWIMLAVLLLPTFYFVQGGVRRLSGKWYHTLICAVPALFLSVQYPVAAVSSFFWWNGSVYYTFFYGLMLWLLGLCLRLWGGEGGKIRFLLRLVPALLLVVAVGWGNYPTALLTVLLLGLGAGAAWGTKKPKRLSVAFTVLFGLAVAALLVSALAPGNQVRQVDYNPDHPGPIVAILRSPLTAGMDLARWTDTKTLLAICLPLPLLAPLLKKCAWDFRRPLLVTLGSFLLFAAQNTPTLYAYGESGPQRLRNIVYYSFFLFFLGNAAYWLGWWQRRTERAEGRDAWRPLLSGSLAVLFAAVCGLGFARDTTAAQCVVDIYWGRAQQYLAEQQEREELLLAPGEENVVLEPFSDRPISLYLGDITMLPGDWTNHGMARFYEKESVVLSADYPERLQN
ncbi:MAG: DUF6056 family protein [Oscillospiraceae bacterium]|nr:DUF6056 family protein [Oscillospiraceae bacterium]